MHKKNLKIVERFKELVSKKVKAKSGSNLQNTFKNLRTSSIAWGSIIRRTEFPS